MSNVILTDTGVVVGSVDVGESSRIVRLLTADHGRLSLLARGARSSLRRFAGSLEAGCMIDFHAQRGKGDLMAFSSIDRVVAPRLARTDLDRLLLAAYGCELCAALAPENQSAPRLFGLLRTWLEVLERPTPPGVASRLALEAKALTFAGYSPVLTRCARCPDALTDPIAFDPEAGGVLHARCGGGAQVTVRWATQVESLRRAPLAETVNVPELDSAWLLSNFASHHLGHSLRSRVLLEGVWAATVR